MPSGFWKYERSDVETGMQRGRNLQLALVAVEHRADPNALVLGLLPTAVELLGRDLERKVVVLTALVIAPIPGTVASDERPGARSGASANQKYATQSPLLVSKKKLDHLPALGRRRSTSLIP